ncbi:MAG: response regulator [Nitrososphaeraceae archaeon]|nr:response regulator [Nitrososphaeraceae archaeon]
MSENNNVGEDKSGATITFSLPAVSKVDGRLLTMDNNRILVVDDEPDLTQVSTLALEYHGFKVDSFNDPQEALSKFEPGLYDLVILNIEMPQMDGFELYHEIKKKVNNAKVCFLTASELYYQEFRKKEYCAIDRNLFIRKPIDNDELIKEINKMIKK